MKFIVHIGSRKKWWEFWKTDEHKKAEKNLNNKLKGFYEPEVGYLLPIDN